jgi:glycerol-3-phosphate dehydrogenase
LLATTDTPIHGDPATVAVSESDIEGFPRHLPQISAAPPDRDKVEFFYAGLRPWSAMARKDSLQCQPPRRAGGSWQGRRLDGLFSALGGKWTTSRALAEKITDALVAELEESAALRHRHNALPGGRFDRFEDMVKGFENLAGISSLRNMAHMLGARLPGAERRAPADLAPWPSRRHAGADRFRHAKKWP